MNNLRGNVALVLALAGLSLGGTGLYFAFKSKQSADNLGARTEALAASLAQAEQRFKTAGQDTSRLEQQVKAMSVDQAKAAGQAQTFQDQVQRAMASLNLQVQTLADQVGALTSRWTAPSPVRVKDTPPVAEPFGQDEKAAPADSPAPSSSAAERTYRIKPGDHLEKIAKAHNTTVQAIEKLNPGIDSRRLQVDQVIRIP